MVAAAWAAAGPMAARADEGQPAAPEQAVPLPARYPSATCRRGDDELGWLAIALRAGDPLSYFIVKGSTHVWAKDSEVELSL